MTNVYIFPRPRGNRLMQSRAADVAAFKNLTEIIVMQQAKAGTLNPVIVAALLAAVMQPSVDVGR